MSTVPSLYDWVGGIAALERLTDLFYRKVRPTPNWGRYSRR